MDFVRDKPSKCYLYIYKNECDFRVWSVESGNTSNLGKAVTGCKESNGLNKLRGVKQWECW